MSIDSSLLLGYYSARISSSLTTPSATARASSSASSMASALSQTPWNAAPIPQAAQDAQVLNSKSYIDLSKVPVSANDDASRLNQDSQKLFSLYTALNNVSYLASMGRRDGMTDGQLAGLNTRFQAGMAEINRFIGTAKFNNFQVQAATPASSVTSKLAIKSASFSYTGSTILQASQLPNPLAGVTSADSFNVAVKKGGTTTNVAINMSGISGPITLDKVLAYTNQQLSAAGFSTRMIKTVTKGSIDDKTNPASYAVQLTPGVNESVSLSSTDTKPALYLSGAQGLATDSATTSANQTGRVIKLDNFDTGSPDGVFSTTIKSDTGLTDAQATAVDSSGNVYAIGNTTGSFGNQMNQASQDVYLSKFDSAGNLQWRQLVGSGASATGYSLAVTPGDGVVVAGTTTGALTSDAISNGGNGSFVTKFDNQGNQTWTKQLKTLAPNQGFAVSVDSTGSIVLGGQVKGTLASGQTNNGGTDSYLVKLSATGTVAYEKQYGTAANEQVSATAFDDNGNLIVATVENGHAVLSKYAGGDARNPAVWSMDLGDLQGGSISGVAVRDGKIALTGTSANGSLNAGGQATTANASSGASDAFVFTATDNGSSVAANQVTYVGTDKLDKAGNAVIDSAGKVYLTGTTFGTFSGQTRNDPKAENMFVTALNTDGTIDWTKQMGGAEGRSTGTGIALDEHGSSMLDVLGLPKGSIDPQQSVDLAQSSNLRAGDSFQIKLEGTATYTTTIRIEKGETMTSLAGKISSAMPFSGKAEAVYANGGKSLKISLKPGVTATLIGGPKDSDALGRLGISPGTLSNTDGITADPNAKKLFGLGLPSNLNIGTKVGAGAARAQLLNVLSSVRDIYFKSTAPAPSTTVTPGKTGGTVPQYLTNQVSSYNLALSMFGGSTDTSTLGTF